MFRKSISSQIVMMATPEQVWRMLTDFAHYAEWNPFIIRAQGEAVQGYHFEGVFRPVGAKPTTLHPVFVTVQDGRELRWRGGMRVPGIFDAEHVFYIEPLPNGYVRLTQQETFRGLAVPFFNFAASQRAFEMMNVALKDRVEQNVLTFA